jgi:non-ribosomal peptide synthase protein (TIGR01720 family)
MPLTPNGKLDRQALPEPDRALPEPSYRAPSTETETLLAAVWQEVLGADRVGIADNFFELGGDSIKAIQVSARLMARGLQLEVKDLFQYPTIEKVSHAVVPAARRSSQEPVRGEGWLTPIQRWFFNRLFVNEHHWNQAVMLFHPEGFDAARIGEALAKIAVHHDALRTVFRSRTIDGLGSEPVPYVRGPEEGPLYTLERFDLTAETNASDLAHIVEGEANRIQRSFRLQEGPLLKAALFHTRDGDHLLLAAHHLVIDGVSWRILFEDLAAAYGQAAAGQEIRLPDKTDSFLEWASRLRTYADSKELQAEASYWKEQMISAEESVLPLPKDSTAPDNRRIHSATAELEFSEERTEQLLKQAHAAYQTETNDLLLCALGMAVQEWNGSGSVLVLLEGHGREELFEGLNITRTVGWFTCQYPVLLDMMHSANLPAQIKSLKEMLRRVPNKGIGYDLLRYAAPEALRSGMRTDREPEISFNYLGQFGTGAQSGGLQPSALDPGDSLSPDSDRGPALSFNGLIEGGRLKLRLEYNLHEFREASIQAFLDSYKRFLLDLIDHCLQKEEIERTPSDFSSKGMEQEEMDDIFELLQNKLG